MNPDILQSIQAAIAASSLSAVLAQPWAVSAPLLAQEYMAGRFRPRMGAQIQQVHPEAMTWEEFCAQRANEKNGLRIYEEAGIAVQPVRGVMYPGTSAEDEAFRGEFNTDRITKACEAVATNPGIKTMVFRMRTPGGSVYGLDPAAKAIMSLRARRKDLTCIAWTTHLCASAGMYIAAACESIHAAPSAIVGSIGTISQLNDWSGFKAKIGLETRRYTGDSPLKALGASPITPEHDAHMKALTALYSREFKSWMAKRRGLKAEDMQGQYGEARHAPAGMVDSAVFPTMESMLAAGLGL